MYNLALLISKLYQNISFCWEDVHERIGTF
jgi:hypothetical protein